MIKKGGINYKLEKKLPNVTQSWFPTVPNRFLSASLNKLHCIAGQQPSRNPKNKQTNSTQPNPTQLNSTQRLIFECLPKIFFQPYLKSTSRTPHICITIGQGKKLHCLWRNPEVNIDPWKPTPPPGWITCASPWKWGKNLRNFRRIPTLEIIIKLQGVSAVELWGGGCCWNPKKKHRPLFLLVNGMCFPFIKKIWQQCCILFLVYFLEGCPKQVMMLGKKNARASQCSQWCFGEHHRPWDFWKGCAVNKRKVGNLNQLPSIFLFRGLEDLQGL